VAYTVPTGWANTLDHQPSYWLRPAADYLADPGSDGNGTTSGIYIWGNVGAALQTDACAERSDPRVRTDAASLAAWMRGLRGLDVRTAPPTEISGRPAIVLDLSLDRAHARTCPFGPFVPLIASRPDAPDAYMWGIGVDESIRMALVDLAGGHTVAVLVDGPADRRDALIAASEPVLASLRLTPGLPS
jgi:hypothetical protein